jgi:hypothetical protein
MEEMLGERFGIAHTTLQVEHVDETLLEISPAPGAGVADRPR